MVLVPAVPARSAEAELYLLVQDQFGIPLVQVSNITQASLYAFNSGLSGQPNMTTYNFSNGYAMARLPQATATCSNQCNESAFSALANYTLNFTSGAVRLLGTDARFRDVSSQLNGVLGQSAQTAGHGYLYTAADLAFLDYINAYYFDAHNVTKDSALSNLELVQSLCTSTLQPQITATNYDYVLGAELRRAWGNYTVNATISAYNQTATDTDSILDSVRSGAEASGWCSAANFIYGYFANSTGQPVTFSSALASTALQRINEASRSGAGLYVVTAQQAYKAKNYPLAILDSDYAIGISNASASQLSTPQLINASQSMSNSTYGVWATEFAKESQFYAYQASAASNATQAHSDAVSAYTAAQLASRIGSDTSLIYGSMVPISGPVQSAQLMGILSQIAYTQQLTVIMLALIAAILTANLVLIIVLIRGSRRGSARRKR